MKKKKMYLVKREVIATSVERAIHTKGVVYEVTLAEDKVQPLEEKPKLGFIKK